MKPVKSVSGCAIILLLAAGVALLLRQGKMDSLRSPSRQQPASAINPTPPAAALRLPPRSFPDDPRPEAQLFYRLAAAANFYNFDPLISYQLTNERPKSLDLGTSSQQASIMGGKIDLAYSYYDGSDTRRKPEAARQWYTCTGKWTEAEAVTETLEILKRLNDTTTLSELSGRHEYEAVELEVPTPRGEKVKVTPFHRVTLFDTNGTPRVDAEFRMGTNGTVGVTRWHCWP